MEETKENIKCSYTELIPLHKLVEHPKNPNKHPDEQIKRLSEIIDYQGMRSPIVVSLLSGFITKGHGRLAALKRLGWENAPIDYQEYADEAQEYADIVADNAISSWADLDLSIINQDFLDLGPDLDIDMLGIKDFAIEPIEMGLPDIGNGSDPDIQQVTFTISNEQKDILDEAMEKARKNLDCTDEINQNKNGNILGAISRHYVAS